MHTQTVAAEPHEDFIANLLRQLEAHVRRRPRHEPTPPCAAGLYQQEKLLMRADSVEKLEAIKKRFLKRKADWQAPMALADLVNSSVAFVLRHVDFDDLESVEKLDEHIASRLQGRARS